MKRNYTLRVKDGLKVVRYESSKIRTFLNKTRTIKWQNKKIEVYVRISENGFWNEGVYTDKKEFEKALKAFLEV